MLHEPTVATSELRPTHLEVSLARIVENYRAIAAHVAPARVMPILKANAYGHGLVPVAKRLERDGAPMVGVAYLEEALRLREEGVRTPVLVLGGIVGSQIPLFLEHDLTLTASSVDKLRAIEEQAAALGTRARVHLKIDTGMARIGVHWRRAEPLLRASVEARHVDVEGIFTHFASADDVDLSSARLQLERWEEVLSFYDKRGLPTPLRHTASSGAIEQLPESHYDLVRPGVLLYGVRPSPAVRPVVSVRPALRWVTRVVYFKVVERGEAVSYAGTWVAPEDTRVVTLPVGYGDGYPRALSGRAEVVVRGARHPVVGRVCMDQVMVAIGRASAWNGDEVTLLGERDGLEVSALELAERAGTIPHDILAGINTRVPRVYVD